jgi:hypothetical protein
MATETRYRPQPGLERPTLTRVEQAINSEARSTPRWHLSTHYNDYTVILEIKYDAVEQSEKRYVAVEGEYFEVVTFEEMSGLEEIARQHGDVLSRDGYHAVSSTAGIHQVFTALTARFEALKFIVDLSYTI